MRTNGGNNFTPGLDAEIQRTLAFPSPRHTLLTSGWRNKYWRVKLGTTCYQTGPRTKPILRPVQPILPQFDSILPASLRPELTVDPSCRSAWRGLSMVRSIGLAVALFPTVPESNIAVLGNPHHAQPGYHSAAGEPMLTAARRPPFGLRNDLCIIMAVERWPAYTLQCCDEARTNPSALARVRRDVKSGEG